MAKQIEGVYERVLACAKKEFLERGYTDASLRTIAKNAETSTSSIYTRFKDKEGLFEEIVGPVAAEMKRMFLEIQQQFHRFNKETQQELVKTYSAEGQQRILDYIYEQFDSFKLLVEDAHGTKFEHFIDELVEIEVSYTYKYMEVIGCESVKSGRVTEAFIHIVTSAYFNGVLEVVKHRMKKEEAKHYLKMLIKYHQNGFDTIFFESK